MKGKEIMHLTDKEVLSLGEILAMAIVQGVEMNDQQIEIADKIGADVSFILIKNERKRLGLCQ